MPPAVLLKYLVDQYGLEKLADLYTSDDFDRVYSQSLIVMPDFEWTPAKILAYCQLGRARLFLIWSTQIGPWTPISKR